MYEANQGRYLFVVEPIYQSKTTLRLTKLLTRRPKLLAGEAGSLS